MASEIRVNQIQSRTGVSTVSFTDTGPIVSGVTTVQGSLDVTGGSVGIGTATATYKLDVESNGNYVASFVQTDTSSAKGGIIIDSKQGRGDLGTWNAITINANDNVSNDSRINWIFDSIADGPAIGGRRTSASGTDLIFYTTTSESLTEKLRIASDGTLSIPGTNSTKDITYGDGTTTGYFRSITDVNRSNAEATIHVQQFKWNNTKVAEIKVLTGDDTTNKDNAHIVFETANSGTTSERLRITSDGSTYTGGSTITESDMNWGHDTYQRPHIFTGQTGGNPSDGAIVIASPETDPSATRVGSLIYGCKTSSATGVNNSGLKAAIDSYTNTNVSDAWKTGGDLRFRTRPDNGNLTERMRIHSNGCITKPGNVLLKVNSTSTYGAFRSLHISPDVSIAQATAQLNIGDTGWATSGANAYTFVCPVTGVYALHAHISLGDVSQSPTNDPGDRIIWSMAYTLGGGNLPLSNYVEVIDTNVFDYENASYFDTWYFTAGTRIGMGINTNSGGSIPGHALSWGAYLLQ